MRIYNLIPSSMKRYIRFAIILLTRCIFFVVNEENHDGSKIYFVSFTKKKKLMTPALTLGRYFEVWCNEILIER